ncbi:MAG: hypothetical protein JHD16_13725 [Solirubrobacteraceae bacterium]|nr:hypothetical protein [Solirubrobacteraceae bacterium]
MSAALPSPAPPVRRARSVAHGTCGEIAQGVLPDGTPFVVTCPIDRGVAVEVEVTAAPSLTIEGLPPGAQFLERALRRTAELVELGPCRMRVEHHSALYVGKGMASSTADIVAAARALSTAVGLPLRQEELAHLAASIEPTDGIMFDGIAASNPRTGERVRRWDWWPQYEIVMVIPPTTLETSAASFAGQDAWADEYAQLLAQLDAAVERRDAAAFAAQATRSGQLNEAFVPSPVRALIEPRAASLGALGVCTAHTGTVAGLLFPHTREGRASASAAARELEAVLPRDLQVTTAQTRPWPVERPVVRSREHQRRATD